MNSLKSFSATLNEMPGHADKMPVLFVGHGNPMNAIEDNEYSRTWAAIGKKISAPKAILCVSAHWQTKGTYVTAMPKPRTIHDFGGFPDELFNTQYPAPGSPAFAMETIKTIKKTTVHEDDEWGLDHGCWSVLKPMFPKADIPVFQLSLDYTQGPQYHYDLAKELAALRTKGVLIIGSGNIVHNLGLFTMKDMAYDWAIEFDEKIKNLIEKKEHQPIINYSTLGKAALLSVPSNEHYLPLLYTLALQDKTDSLQFFNDKTTAGSISMRSVILS